MTIRFCKALKLRLDPERVESVELQRFQRENEPTGNCDYTLIAVMQSGMSHRRVYQTQAPATDALHDVLNFVGSQPAKGWFSTEWR